MDYKISSNIFNSILIINIDKDIDDYYFLELKKVILNQLHDNHIIGILLDYSNVQVLDYNLANKMLGLTKSIKLMGFTSVITGLKPELVMTLISFGFNNSDIFTKLNLEHGISYIQNQQHLSSSTLGDINLNEKNNIK